MTSYLADINVWLALTWGQHPQHLPASRWYADIDEAALLFCRFTMLGFLRFRSCCLNRRPKPERLARLRRASAPADDPDE